MSEDFTAHGDREAESRRSWLGTQKLPCFLYCLSHLPNDHTNIRKIFHKSGFKISTFFLVFVSFSSYTFDRSFPRLIVIQTCVCAAWC